MIASLFGLPALESSPSPEQTQCLPERAARGKSDLRSVWAPESTVDHEFALLL